MASARCPQCAFESPSAMRFCGRCGAALAARCPHCGAEAPPDFRFCGHCGKSLQETPARPAPEHPVYTPKHLADKILRSRSALEGERRQVTVLFADVAGFTSLAEKLDPEDVHRNDLALKGPQPAVALFEETLERARKAFGAHRWRWSIHLSFGLTTALVMLGRDGEALAEANRGLAEAEQTDSLKYVGWFHARRGEIALRAGDTAAAVESLDRAVAIARRIAYPTLTWQAADLLARANLALGAAEKAGAAARLAEDTVAAIAAAAPESSLADTLWRWPRVLEMQGTVERVRRM